MNRKSTKEIAKMAESGKILAEVLHKCRKKIIPGAIAAEIDEFAEKEIIKLNAEPGFKNYNGFPNTLCLSINEEVVHGLPTKNKIIKPGDIVSIDCGVKYKGWNSDAAFTLGVGKIKDNEQELISITKTALEIAIKYIKPGIKINIIQEKMQSLIENAGFSVIRSLSGHGIGKNLHESPSIFNFVDKNNNFCLEEGMTICIEPMVAMGNFQVKTEPDGWSIKTVDKSNTAHFEHTIAITKYGAQVLTKLN